LLNGGDIIAQKVTDGGKIYVKIFQREKKNIFTQGLFRLYDSLSTNNINVTVGLEKNSTKLLGPENQSISAMLNIKKDNKEKIFTKNNNEKIDHYFYPENNDQLIDYLISISNPIKDFCLPEHSSKYDKGKFRDSQDEKAITDIMVTATQILSKKLSDAQQEKGGQDPHWAKTSKFSYQAKEDVQDSSLLEKTKYLRVMFNSKPKYVHFDEYEKFINIKKELNLDSLNTDPELNGSVKPEKLKKLKEFIDFMDGELLHGPAKILLSEIKDEFKGKLDSNVCKRLYNNYNNNSEWNEKKYGKIVDYIFNMLSTDFSTMPIKTCNFLRDVFNELNKENPADKKINPCLKHRLNLYLQPLRDRIQLINEQKEKYFETANY